MLKARLAQGWSSQTARTVMVFAAGNGIVSILSGVAGLLQARWITPEMFGEFRTYAILTGYFNIGLIFVHDALARQFPYLLGKGEKEQAYRTAATAKWWYLFLVWTYSVFFGCLTCRAALRGEWHAVFGWGAQIAAVWMTIYGAYQTILYRTSTEFKRLSYNSLITSASGFIALLLVKVWGYWGLALRFIWNAVISVVINHHYLPVRVKAQFSREGLLALAKVALPLSAPGYIQTSFLSASIAALILQRLGREGLGYYGVALTFQGFALTLTSAFHQIFSVKMTMRYGETHDFRKCVRYGFRSASVSFVFSFGIAVLFCLAIPYLIQFLLPKYMPVIGVASILVFYLPVMALGLPTQMLSITLCYSGVLTVALVKAAVVFGMTFLFASTINQFALCVIGSEVVALLVGYGVLYLKVKIFSGKADKFL